MVKKKTNKKEVKKEVKKVKPTPKMKTIFRVKIEEQWRDFNSQKQAREFGREVLQNDAIYFMEMTKERVGEKE